MSQAKVTVCVPHWQVREMMSICLRALRRHSDPNEVEILVVDNGSKDDSLDWLRSLSWIRLIERPEESSANWPTNVFTAWDLAARVSKAEYLVTMHSDVFIRRNDWLDPFLREMNSGSDVAAAGSGKLSLENPLYAWQKEFVGDCLATIKGIFGRSTRQDDQKGRYPRDYCAIYRRELLVKHDLTFVPDTGEITGGYPIARRLRELGYDLRVFPLAEMSARLVHVTHASAALTSKSLHHKRAQSKAERRAAAFFRQPWIRELRENHALDAA